MQQAMQLRGTQCRALCISKRTHRSRPFAGKAIRPVRGLAVRASANPVQNQKFDYIVVGGGTAGCVLANRLTADGSKSVLLIEAGVDSNSLEVKVPAGITRLFKNPVLDWGLLSDLQKQLAAREIYLARGKLLGGSSCTNATLYMRGSAQDYDNWGVEGWSSKDVLPWYIQAENNTDVQDEFHGVGGMMNVENPRYQNKLFDEFFKAADAVGLPRNSDFNNWGREQVGYGQFQTTTQKGERADMARQYLRPAMQRGNLKVLTSAVTTKIQFEDAKGTPVAKGVEFSTSGAAGARFTAEVAPGGEVVLCAGAVHSPHLLQLSGVGPASHLKDNGIDVVVDLPGVGKNLQDHPATQTAFLAKPEFKGISVTSEIYDDNINIKIGAVLDYLLFKKGPLATTGCDRGAFVSTTGKGQADVQYRFVAGCALEADGVKAYATFGNLKREGRSWPDGFTLQTLVCRPASRGSVGLKSDSPFAQPDINIGYFTDAEGKDLKAMKEGLKLAKKIALTEPLKGYVQAENWPGSGYESDEKLEEYIRGSVHSGNALVGTCRMGASASEGAVVDPSLKVHGIEGLRVVDASVMPLIPGGQTGAPVVMIAERAAAMLTSGAAAPSKPAAAAREPVAV